MRFLGSGISLELYLTPLRDELESKFVDGEIPGQEWLALHFNTSAVVELALIQFWILMGIADRLRYRKWTSTAELADLRLEALTALEEYHRVTPLSFADASELVSNMKQSLGADHLYGSIQHQLRELEQVFGAVESKQRSRRDRLVSAGTGIAALILGLPGISALVERLSRWSRDDVLAASSDRLQWLAPLFDYVADREIEVTIGLYVALLLVLGALTAWSLLPARADVDPLVELNKPRRQGFAWPGPSNIQWIERAKEPDRPKSRSGGPVES